MASQAAKGKRLQSSNQDLKARKKEKKKKPWKRAL